MTIVSRTASLFMVSPPHSFELFSGEGSWSALPGPVRRGRRAAAPPGVRAPCRVRPARDGGLRRRGRPRPLRGPRTRTRNEGSFPRLLAPNVGGGVKVRARRWQPHGNVGFSCPRELASRPTSTSTTLGLVPGAVYVSPSTLCAAVTALLSALSYSTQS